MRHAALRILSLLLLGLQFPLFFLASAAATAEEPSKIRFAFPDQNAAKALLSQSDTYTNVASPFDRKVRMGVANDPGMARHLEFVAAQVLPWTSKDRENIQAAIDQLKLPLKGLFITLNSPVNLIHTTGKEESGAAYTRGNEIVFPTRELRGNSNALPRLMAHELFHVISRQHPLLRDQLYQLIGFEKANPIELPENLSALRITNPDAPVIEHVMQLKISTTETVHIAPMLMAKSDYVENGPASLFAYLSFKLMQVKKTNEGWVADQTGGDPVFHSPQTADFQRQIGKNTGYIIHPEEILADNFALIMTNGPVVDSWLTDKMKAVIKGYFGPKAEKKTP